MATIWHDLRLCCPLYVLCMLHFQQKEQRTTTCRAPDPGEHLSCRRPGDVSSVSGMEQVEKSAAGECPALNVSESLSGGLEQSQGSGYGRNGGWRVLIKGCPGGSSLRESAGHGPSKEGME